ncbi:UDP-N-acetylmuramoyl-L-alanyl-D-glutamate synthetase [Fimbriimonas ginsengisoli Gsoil 348]|uniref:UDP-N-acetylmuramoylalanine--D-glutamate ligase n=2 Tax=Fimbriimonas ginsengisoli TaxID=1005039 RepID=A0A068NXJ6_FIMGI|nr:UDP-N-acetylmuramoyl-L-alanyl-D-glutamate synthetase [Fimbriimonas ginsengisoli Gsoil 348]
MRGKKIAVFGLGRSGLAIGRAALAEGAYPRVFDQKPLESLPKRDAYDEAIAAGIDITLGWDGVLPEDIDLLVANPAVPKDHPTLKLAAVSGIEVISEAEFAYRISKAPIVAITGTNGKSTTTVMTYLCLRACGEDAVLCGNIFGSGYPEMPMTEAAMNSTPDQILVAEISSFQLEWVVGFRPAAAGITNIWPDHLDRYSGFDEYAATKQRIFACQTAEDFAVVKANDPVVRIPGPAKSTLRRGTRPRSRLSIGSSEVEASYPTVFTIGATGEHAQIDDLNLTILDQKIRLEDLPFSEPHNYLNASMAALLAYGVLRFKAARDPDSNAAAVIREAEDTAQARRNSKRSVYSARTSEPSPLALPPQIVEGLKSFHGLAHRMELVGERNRIRVVNNSMCTNPDAVIKSAMSLRDPAHLLIGGVNKGLDFGPLRHYLANHRHRAYLFGTDAADLNKMLGETYPVFRTLDEAFHAATEAAVGGEVIMLAPGCASTDQYKDFRDRGDVFRNLAKEWLSR